MCWAGPLQLCSEAARGCQEATSMHMLFDAKAIGAQMLTAPLQMQPMCSLQLPVQPKGR